jgi:hypothetical protein
MQDNNGRSRAECLTVYIPVEGNLEKINLSIPGFTVSVNLSPDKASLYMIDS